MVGAYFHEDTNLAKALGYAPWLGLFEDGNYWSVFFESHNDASSYVPVKDTDQRLYRSEGCRLAAVWFRVATAAELKHKDQHTETVHYHWRPEFEVNPGPTVGCWEHPDFLPQDPEDRIYNRMGQPVTPEEAKRRTDRG